MRRSGVMGFGKRRDEVDDGRRHRASLCRPLAGVRAGEITQAQLRAFAEAHGLEQRLQAALQRGAGGGRLDAIPHASRPGATTTARPTSRKRPTKPKRTKTR